jgi:hypothetical protein
MCSLGYYSFKKQLESRAPEWRSLVSQRECQVEFDSSFWLDGSLFTSCATCVIRVSLIDI